MCFVPLQWAKRHFLALLSQGDELSSRTDTWCVLVPFVSLDVACRGRVGAKQWLLGCAGNVQRQNQLLELIGTKQAAFRSAFGFDEWRSACEVPQSVSLSACKKCSCPYSIQLLTLNHLPLTPFQMAACRPYRLIETVHGVHQHLLQLWVMIAENKEQLLKVITPNSWH